MRRLPPLLLAAACLAVLAVLAQAILRSQTGPLPLAGVFELHLLGGAALLALLAVPWVLGGGRGKALARLAVVAIVVVAVVRGGGEVWSPAPASAGGGGTSLTVLSWNLEVGSKAASTTVAGIAGADVVALQELTPEVADAIEADPALAAAYPYRLLEPREGAAGMGILSRLPLAALGSEQDPYILRAGIRLPDGRRVELLDVHPYPPGISALARIPVGLDTRRVDADLELIAERVRDAADGLVLVAGDLNTTPTQPGFAALGNLTDAHAAVGTGPGFTWRPSSLEGLGVALLRLDHVLAGPGLEPVVTSTDCSIAGDHCRLLVTLRVPPPTD